MGRASRRKHQRPRNSSDGAVARWNAAAFGLATPLVILAAGIVWTWIDEPPTSGGQLVAATLGVSVPALLAWRIVSARVTVTPTALAVRGILRSRSWRWEDIQSLEWERPLWVRLFFYRFGGARVRVRLKDGRSSVPLALCGTIDYDRIGRVVTAGRRCHSPARRDHPFASGMGPPSDLRHRRRGDDGGGRRDGQVRRRRRACGVTGGGVAGVPGEGRWRRR